MKRTPLFSSFRQGENRVTASVLAVFERINPKTLEQLLANLSGESTVGLVTFAVPIGIGRRSVPDAQMSANFRYLFDVKTARNDVSRRQIAEHLQLLDGGFADERLFLVTPDAEQPHELIGVPKVVWVSFQRLNQAIEDLVTDPTAISEQERFLLRELQALFEHEGLLSGDDVVVVAAGFAYQEYLQYSAYICQAGRSFHDGLQRMAFYSNGAIQRHIPKILARRDNVLVDHASAQALLASDLEEDRQIGQLIEQLLASRTKRVGNPHQIFLLSPVNDKQTMVLPQPIQNAAVARNGQPTAWTQSQRYVRFEVLSAAPKTTRELDQHST